jgi:DNA-binding CsgD family transcriptional regulator
MQRSFKDSTHPPNSQTTDAQASGISIIWDAVLLWDHLLNTSEEDPALLVSGQPQVPPESGMPPDVLAPLFCQGRVIGALRIISQQERTFGPQELALVEHLARQISQTLETKELSEHMRILQDRVFGLNEQGDSRLRQEGTWAPADGYFLIGDSLSPREMDVLALLATGTGNEQISSKLGISLNTVKTHVRHIKAKLGTANRAETALAASRILDRQNKRIRHYAVEVF